MQIIGVGSDIAMCIYIYICKYDQTINHKINMYYMTSSSCQEYRIARFRICLIVYVQTDGQQWHLKSFQLSSWLSSVRRTVDGKFKEKRSWFTFVIGVIGISSVPWSGYVMWAKQCHVYHPFGNGNRSTIRKLVMTGGWFMIFFYPHYPLVNVYIAIENGPVEIVDLPIKHGDFP